MALPSTVGGGAPNVIEQMRSCLEDPDGNGVSRRHIGGRMKRDRLAAIASNLGLANKPWAGHILALLSESLDISVINKIMTEGPGRYQKEWDKWDLGEGRPAWENRRGEDKIRNFVYDLLIQDLIILYNGYEVDGGSRVSHLSVREVCKKVKDEIGLAVIKDSHLRDQLKSYGVPLRNGKGEAIVRNDRSTQSMGSPSTLGVRTPTSTDIPPASPRPNSTDRVVHSISNAPSRLPTPIRRPSALHASSGHSSPSNTTAATQRPIQQRLPHTTNYYSESRINSPSNINPSQHQTLQNSKHAAISAGGDLNPTTPSVDETFTGMNDGPHSGQLISPSSHLMPLSNEHFDNQIPRSFTPMLAESWPMEEELDPTAVDEMAWNTIDSVEPASYTDSPFPDSSDSFPLPLPSTAQAQSNNAVTELFEKFELLTRRFDTEHTARVLLEARANEVDEWKKNLQCLGKTYEELSLDYANQGERINGLEDLCAILEQKRLSEQTNREKLSDDMEILQQRYYDLDGTVQRLRNANGELQSRVLSLQGKTEMQARYISDLETGHRKLDAQNTELKTDLSILQAHNDSLRTTVAQHQITNNQLQQRVRRLKDDNVKLDGKVEILQREKDCLQNDVAELQDAKAKVDHEVDLLRRENASLQKENREPKIRPSKESQDRFSNCTIDSGLGESPRTSVASSRKRQISITDERKEKRHRSVDVISNHAGTFLADPDVEDFTIMPRSELPIRSGPYTD